MHKFLGSSVDETKLSLTIKGVGVWLIPALLALVTFIGWDVTQVDLVALVDNLAKLAGLVMVIYGLGRKIYYKII